MRVLLSLLLLGGTFLCRGADLSPLPWKYTLLEGSFILDECRICGRPSILEPVKGSFTLEVGSSTNEYLLTNIQFTNLITRVTGSGSIHFEKGTQVEKLQLQIVRNEDPPENVSLTNEISEVSRPFPMLSFVVTEETTSLTRVFSAGFAAAPLREIWFSTTSQFTSATRPSGNNVITPAEILSMHGTTVKKPADLSSLLNLDDPTADLGTDALDVGAGGEIFYSPGQYFTSTTLGEIGEGDLITDNGRIVLYNQQLLAGFMAEESEEVLAGLDAIQQISDEEYYFSIRTAVTSTLDGTQLFPGDILSSRGFVVKAGKELIQAFQPVEAEVEAGLDAFYIWPHGEIWFSTEGGFDSALGAIFPGDIVSDQGYVVFRNLDLLTPFAPMEDANNFGLDALFVVTDVDVRGNEPRFTEVSREGGGIRLNWEGTGRAYQLLKAGTVNGLWEEISPVTPNKSYVDQSGGGAGFYRLLQW